MACNIQPDTNYWLSFVHIDPSGTDPDSTDHETIQGPANEGWKVPQDQRGCSSGRKPLPYSPLLARLGVSIFEVREDDLELTSTRLVFRTSRNDAKIYDALMQLAVVGGHPTNQDALTIRIGYSALSKASGCSPRALGRAWPRLIDWGFLRSMEPHIDRQPTRTREWASMSVTRYTEMYAGLTFRITRSGKLQPFRSVSNTGEAAK